MKILLVNSSTRGDGSQSLTVSKVVVAELMRSREHQVDQFDLFDSGLPPFSGKAVGAKMALFTGGEADSAEKEAWQRARAVFDRFATADIYIFAVPLWNNGIPYVLKQFIDIVTQPGWAFGFDLEKGYSGLLHGKAACVVHASGVYHEQVSPNFGSDFATPYLDDWLKFIGVQSVSHLHVAPTVVNSNYAATLEDAQKHAVEIARRLLVDVHA